MEVIQEFPFKDENFGYDGDHILLNNPAHEHTDHNGVTWSNIMVFLPNWWTVSAKQWYTIVLLLCSDLIPLPLFIDNIPIFSIRFLIHFREVALCFAPKRPRGCNPEEEREILYYLTL